MALYLSRQLEKVRQTRLIVIRSVCLLLEREQKNEQSKKICVLMVVERKLTQRTLLGTT